MHHTISTGLSLLFLTAVLTPSHAPIYASTHALAASTAHAKADGPQVIILFSDGHQQSIPASSIATMSLKSPSGMTIPIAIPLSNGPSKRSLLGKWQVGSGMGSSTFNITLKDNGEARKDLGPASHGTWSYSNGEVVVTWDDGWHDVLRKSGSKWLKFAYTPGASLSSAPANIAQAHNTTPEPI